MSEEVVNRFGESEDPRATGSGSPGHEQQGRISSTVEGCQWVDRNQRCYRRSFRIKRCTGASGANRHGSVPEGHDAGQDWTVRTRSWRQQTRSRVDVNPWRMTCVSRSTGRRDTSGCLPSFHLVIVRELLRAFCSLYGVLVPQNETMIPELVEAVAMLDRWRRSRERDPRGAPERSAEGCTCSTSRHSPASA